MTVISKKGRQREALAAQEDEGRDDSPGGMIGNLKFWSLWRRPLAL
jgi:hypothetical protein